MRPMVWRLLRTPAERRNMTDANCCSRREVEAPSSPCGTSGYRRLIGERPLWANSRGQRAIRENVGGGIMSLVHLPGRFRDGGQPDAFKQDEVRSQLVFPR